MATNKQLIQKADVALADLTGNGGYLNPEQSSRFFRKLIASPTILPKVRTVFMKAPTMKINKIGFGSRIMAPATQAGGALDAGGNARYVTAANRAKPTFSQINLTTSEGIAEVRIPYEVLEDNVEGGSVSGSFQEGAGGLHQTIVDLLAQRAALDLEELFIQGDTTSGVPWLALMDGILKKTVSNVVAANSVVSKDMFKTALKTIPPQYLRNRAALLHFVSVNNETEMRDQYANRPTGLGDANLQGNLPLYVFGSQVQGAAMMPAANGLFGDPSNYIFGLQRQIMMEYDKDIRSREYIIVLTLRLAIAVEEEVAAVKYTSIS
jgi:HK97 family phage major capsid protein